MLASERSTHDGSGVRRSDRTGLAGLGALVAPGAAARPRVRPTSCSSSSTTSASHSSVATARDIATPTIDRLAAGGVRLANFHTTALCSPTRACLLTGRNHHRSGMGRVADLAIGLPGLLGQATRARTATCRRSCARSGYATYAVGKWHLTPEDETHMAGSRATWPLGRGFDRWYGFHGGETHQFVPALYHDNHSVRPPRSVEDGYHLSADLADRAIEFLGDLRAVDADQPFFLYFCTGACHSPHQAPRRVDRALPGPLRRGLGRVAGADLRPPARARAHSPGHRALAPAALGPGLGRRSATGPAGGGRPVHGVLRRLPVPHRRTRSAGCWASSTDLGELDDTVVIVGLGQRRQRRGRAGGLHQRRPAVEPRPGRPRPRCTSASTRSAAR